MDKRDLHDATMAAQRFAKQALAHLDRPNAAALKREMQALREALEKLDGTVLEDMASR